MWLVDALLPEFCVRCKGEGSVFCLRCQAAWWPEPDLASPRGVVQKHFSLGSYRDQVLQNLLRLWKYHSVAHAKDALLTIVRQTVGDYAPAIPPVEAVSFVPLHWRKRNERGFDQAEETAWAVAQALGVPCLSLIERTRYTAQQAQIDRAERQAQEFHGVFAPVAGVALPESVLLVDDVWTTGTTISAAAEALKAAGVKQVHAFTIAKG